MNRKFKSKKICLLKILKKNLLSITGLAIIILSFSSILNGMGNGSAGTFAMQQVEKSKEKPLIFPIPSEVLINEGIFSIDKITFIMIPEKESKSDDFLAKLLFNEFVDKYERPISIVRKTAFSDKDKFILIGDITNPLVRNYCEKKGLFNTLKELGTEGYILSVTDNNIVVAANSKNGALFGLESLRQILNKDGETVSVQQLVVKDSPKYAFRGIKLYLPGRENIPFFKRFIKDFVALYKFNKIILELNANMRLERHPELNIGTVEFERHLNFSRLDRPPGIHKEYQNSSHQDNADGEILEKEEVADLVNYIRKFNIEVIPELPSLTHSYYLLFGHGDLAENMNQPYPDTYCPLKPEIYKIYFDVLDEYIDVIHPSIIHVGHDEWRMEKDICELCRGKDYGQLYADDLTKIHDYLNKKGIKTAIWGDHLLESVTEKDHQTWKSSAGYQYKIPGALRSEQVLKLIPKDIIVFNWFWDDINNDKQVSEFGFQQVYGNFRPDIDKWSERFKIKGVLGGAPSSWAGTTEMNFGKDQIFDFLGSANLLWSKHYLSVDKLAIASEPLISEIYTDFSGQLLPSDAGSKVIPVNLSSHLNSSLTEGIDSLNYTDLLVGPIRTGYKIFNLNSSADKDKRAISVFTLKDGTKSNSVQGIKINKDVNSIIFLHASAKEGSNKKAYDIIYNFEETSELLGWYEIIYEDGFVETIPIRYGLNILDWRWRKRIIDNEKPKVKYNQNTYTYQASAVECSRKKSDPVTFFAFEWQNTRFGKQIKEINLKSVNYNKNNENAIILLAVSISENTKVIDAKGTERQ
jgi:hypothetical protein